MNYYIQGSPANADQIKAAFEKKGLITSGRDYHNDNILFFTYDLEGGCKVISSTNANLIMAKLIKTHPDYKELELPVKPKFKAGDWLWKKEKCAFPVLIAGYDEERGYLAKYIDSESYFMRYATENEYRLWAIQDARDGDVLVCYSEVKGKTIEQAGIFKQYVGRHGGCSNAFLAHTGIDWDGNIIINGYMGSTNILPATKEQRDLLFAKMKEAGYEWNADKKELKKIQPHYDIANFHAGMPVLVMDKDNRKWCYLLYSHYDNTYEDGLCFNAGSVDWRQCIPFNDDTKHLLGTTDMPSDEYINW